MEKAKSNIDINTSFMRVDEVLFYPLIHQASLQQRKPTKKDTTRNEHTHRFLNIQVTTTSSTNKPRKRSNSAHFLFSK